MAGRVYVGRLHRDATKRDLQRLLRECGQIRDIIMKTGYGFVEFADTRDAYTCVSNYNGREFFGERIVVQLAKGGKPQHTLFRVQVTNIRAKNWHEVKDLFRRAGEISYVDFHPDKQEAMVEYTNIHDMKIALKQLNEYELYDEKLGVSEYKERNYRSARSRSRSPSSRRRSRSPRGRSPDVWGYGLARDRDRDRERRRRSRSRSPRY